MGGVLNASKRRLAHTSQIPRSTGLFMRWSGAVATGPQKL